MANLQSKRFLKHAAFLDQYIIRKSHNIFFFFRELQLSDSTTTRAENEGYQVSGSLILFSKRVDITKLCCTFRLRGGK